MNFSEKIKKPLFWKNTFRIATPFFLFMIVLSLLFNSWQPIFQGDFSTVAEQNFLNNKWIIFFGFKFFLAFGYGFFITYKNMK